MFSVTAPTVGHSGESRWILATGATYHACLNKDWFSSFEKLDDGSVVMGDDRPCNMEGICTCFIKTFNGMVWELTEVRYVLQLNKNLISIGALKALNLKISDRDGVLKRTRGSMIVMKGV